MFPISPNTKLVAKHQLNTSNCAKLPTDCSFLIGSVSSTRALIGCSSPNQQPPLSRPMKEQRCVTGTWWAVMCCYEIVMNQKLSSFTLTFSGICVCRSLCLSWFQTNNNCCQLRTIIIWHYRDIMNEDTFQEHFKTKLMKDSSSFCIESLLSKKQTDKKPEIETSCAPISLTGI